ncbi:MAG: ATP-binding protein [Roseburia sp.]|nr:ATP-binding protein [Roseburia sp.]
MALTNSQYDEIQRGYDARQLRNKDLLSARTKEVYAKVPQLQELDHAIAECSVSSARKFFDGDETAIASLKEQLASLRTRKADLLKAHGYPENYLQPVYSCPDCKDTGFINGSHCHCFTQQAIDMIYTQSNIKDILSSENFSTFSFDYYSKEAVSQTTGLTSLETAKAAYATCQDFVKNFNTDFSNILFYGDTGTGKTFLSNCIAKELLDAGHSVIYFTAFQLFDILSKGIFDKDNKAIDAHQNIFDCDLLIIDDLGTELVNSFTTSQLFLCLNERILRKKSTIISTNLNLGQIADIYSERVLSRVAGHYTIIKMFGDDIRMKKRIH